MQSSWRTHSFAFHPPTHDGTLPARRQDDGHPGTGGCRQIEEPWQWIRHGRRSGNTGSDINCRRCRGCVSGSNSEAADNRAHLPLSKCAKMDRQGRKHMHWLTLSSIICSCSSTYLFASKRSCEKFMIAVQDYGAHTTDGAAQLEAQRALARNVTGHLWPPLIPPCSLQMRRG